MKGTVPVSSDETWDSPRPATEGLGIVTHRLVNFCWFWFKWSLVACAIGAAVAVPYFYNRLDEELRTRVEARIARQYPQLRVRIRSAVLIKGEGIAVRGLSILDPAAEGPGAELLKYDECFLGCRTDLRDLFGDELTVTRVTLRRPTLRMTRRPDGTWSAAKLLPLPRFGPGHPEITVENGTIEVFDPLQTPSAMLTLHDVNLTLAAPIDPAAPDRRKMQGTLSGEYFRQVIFEGEVDPRQPGMALSGSIEGLEISPEFRGTLPGSLGQRLAALGTLRGQAELSFRVSYDPGPLKGTVPVSSDETGDSPRRSPWQFDLSGRLVRGRLDDPRLPHPLTEIRTLVHVNNEGFAVEDFTARSNQAAIQMTCRGSGLTAAGPLALELKVRQLELDHQLLDVLPEGLQEQWYKCRPEGRVDAEAKLSYDGRAWKPELLVSCQNVSFTHHKFPYRLDHGRGTLSLANDLLRISLTAYSENQLVRIDGEVRSPLRGAYGWVQAKCEELPLDQKLLLALPPSAQALARALDLRGTIRGEYRLWRDSAGEPFHQHLSVWASRCWLRYEHFPYSVANLRGTLEMQDGTWSFRDLEGGNGTSRLRGEGTLTATPQGNELALHLSATDVPLEDELRDALQPAMRQVWQVLNPHGIIDLSADVRYVDQTHQFDLSVCAAPRTEACSIEPLSFPYRLEKLRGMLTYSNGRVAFERFRAEHGPVSLTTSGDCRFTPDGGWLLRLEALTVDRLRLDRELMQAIPARLRKALGELNPSGLVSLRGKLDVARGGSPDEPVRSQWDVVLGLEQVSVDSGIRLDNIHGSLALAGGLDGQSFHSGGELALDSLGCKDCQFTQVLGPLWIDDQQLLFGSWVGQRQNQGLVAGGQPPRPLRPLTAKLFGGSLYGDAWLAPGARPRYGLQVTLVDADLAAAARELLLNRQNLRGRLQGTLALSGAGHSRNTWSGRGNIHLRDANVYELPVMIAMLKILSVRAPDPNAFSKSDVDFHIQGEHVYFEKINFTGDAISLLGKGEMNFEGETRMTFTPVVGRAEVGIPILRNLFTGASQQLMVIHVGGNIQNPDIRKEAMPGVNQALQNLQGRASDLGR